MSLGPQAINTTRLVVGDGGNEQQWHRLARPVLYRKKVLGCSPCRDRIAIAKGS